MLLALKTNFPHDGICREGYDTAGICTCYHDSREFSANNTPFLRTDAMHISICQPQLVHGGLNIAQSYAL
jgi:hypothetical protein